MHVGRQKRSVSSSEGNQCLTVQAKSPAVAPELFSKSSLSLGPRLRCSTPSKPGLSVLGCTLTSIPKATGFFFHEDTSEAVAITWDAMFVVSSLCHGRGVGTR